MRCPGHHCSCPQVSSSPLALGWGAAFFVRLEGTSHATSHATADDNDRKRGSKCQQCSLRQKQRQDHGRGNQSKDNRIRIHPAATTFLNPAAKLPSQKPSSLQDTYLFFSTSSVNNPEVLSYPGIKLSSLSSLSPFCT